MSNIRLKRDRDALVIGADFWDEVLDWAEQNGWRPHNSPTLYRTDTGLTVTDFEANDLADALEVIAGELVLCECDVPEKFLRDLTNALLELTTFFQAGSFKIC